jgi:hypothetical protein
VSNEDLYVLLGCFGRRDEDFISCAGIENRILKVDPSLGENLDKAIEYFEGCRLFDKPLFDLNGVRNFIFFMQNNFHKGPMPLWRENKFILFQKFILDHRFCGVYIKLILVDSNNEPAKLPDETESIFIKGSSGKILTDIKPKLSTKITHPNKRIIRVK